MEYKLNSLTPMLETKDLKATVDFYTSTLGFTCDNYSVQWGWANIRKDKIDIMFTVPNKHRGFTEPVMSGSLYMNTDNVDSVWEALKDKCKVCYPIENFEYGMREFAVYDNNGYLLQFGQEIKE